MQTGYKALTADFAGPYTGWKGYDLPKQREDGTWKPGRWMKIESVYLCTRGFHYCETVDDLSEWYAPDYVYYKVEVKGTIKEGMKKAVATDMRFLEPVHPFSWVDGCMRKIESAFNDIAHYFVAPNEESNYLRLSYRAKDAPLNVEIRIDGEEHNLFKGVSHSTPVSRILYDRMFNGSVSMRPIKMRFLDHLQKQMNVANLYFGYEQELWLETVLLYAATGNIVDYGVSRTEHSILERAWLMLSMGFFPIDHTDKLVILCPAPPERKA